MSDLTEIENQGMFAKCIRYYFLTYKPKIIIETGLYHGTGSTRIISSLIKEIPIENAEFYSIECSENNIKIAKDNLTKLGLIDYVDIISGLSIPEEFLPSQDDIIKIISDASKAKGIKLDHEQDPKNGFAYYQTETSNFEQEDILGSLINKFNGHIDFMLLDSGGHVGNIEFKYVLGLLKSRCAIALDDTRHVKHYSCLEMIKNDKRFELLYDNEEKFGSALAIFRP